MQAAMGRPKASHPGGTGSLLSSASRPPTPMGSGAAGGSALSGGAGSRFSIDMMEPKRGRMETWIVLELCDLGSLQARPPATCLAVVTTSETLPHYSGQTSFQAAEGSRYEFE
jgi:hypothetical protein